MSDLGPGGHASGKNKILIFCDSYLPSVQGGGGVWTVVNLVDRFCDRYDFFIVTRNYDGKGDRSPFSTVKTGEWNPVGNASVYYLAAQNVTQTACAGLLQEVAPDCVFLNSTMSAPCVKFLMARRRGIAADVPVVLAPCGELSPGALRGKKLKKKTYLSAARTTGLFDCVIWKASTDIEVEEIRQAVRADAEIMIAPDLTPKTILADYSAELKPKKQSGAARFVFLSRVVRKKNLVFFLELLQPIMNGTIHLDIVGPLEDQAYWRECESLISTLPPNVTVEVVGPVTYEAGLQHLCAGHFFVLPTLGENFGYVFIESLAAGTPVLTSDKVVWDDLEEKNVGWRIRLQNRDAWLRQIDRCIEMDNSEYQNMSAAARQYAVEWLARSELEEATAKVLARALKSEAK